MARLSALWWWIDRWRKSTAYTDMTLEQQGAYRNLLDEACLRGGPIPDDDRILAKACGDAKRWARVRAVVLARFRLTKDGWRNETLDSVLLASDEIRQRRAEAGRQGADARWQTHSKRDGKSDGKTIANDMANAMAKGMAPDPYKTKTPSPAREESAPKARGSDPSDAPSRDLPRRYAPGGRAAHAASAHVNPSHVAENRENSAVPIDESAHDSARTLKKSELSGRSHRAEPPEDPRVTAVFGPRR